MNENTSRCALCAKVFNAVDCRELESLTFCFKCHQSINDMHPSLFHILITLIKRIP